MKQYIFKRILLMMFTLFIISVLLFTIVKCMPNDPVDSYFGIGNASVESKENLRDQLGLNDPLPEQYFRWITNVLQGNFGVSLRYKQDVSELMIKATQNTIYLNLGAMLLSICISIIISIYSIIKPSKWLACFLDSISLAVMSLPGFFFAMLAIYFVSYSGIDLPISGNGDSYYIINGYPDVLTKLIDVISHALLPLIVLTIMLSASFLRFLRNSLDEVKQEDYVLLAKSKGLGNIRIAFYHIFRNVLSSFLTYIGNYFPFIFSGSLLIENLFNRSGIGTLLLNSIRASDDSVICAILFVTAIITLVGNFIFDIFSMYADPRLLEKERENYNEIL